MKSFDKEYGEFLEAVQEGEYHGYNVDDAVGMVWDMWEGSLEQRDAQERKDLRHMMARLAWEIDKDPHAYPLEYCELVKQLDHGEIVP